MTSNTPIPFAGKHPSPTVEADLREIEARAAEDLARLAGKRVLVTGGAGFLLSYLVDLVARLAAREQASGRAPGAVVVVDSFRSGTRERLAHLAGSPFVTVRDRDVASAAPWDDRADVVVHGASIASPTFYRRHPLETIEANVLGTLQLLREFAGQPLDAFVLMSTSEVYGDPDPARVPTSEDYVGSVSCTGPRACYDESKRLAETLATTFHRTHGTPVRIVRPFNVYGPGLRPDDGRVVPSLASAALAGEDLVLHSDGSPRRALCYVTDFIVGFLRVLTRGADGEPYNVGDDSRELSMRELAETIRSVAKAPGAVRVQASPDVDYLVDNPQRRCPDLGKLRALGAPPAEVDLDEGLARYLAWLRERTDAPALAAPRAAAS